MNQPPIDNQFVQPGREQFTSDTPKTDLACSGPPETVVARLRELSCGLERQVDRLCKERENISDFNAVWHKEMTSRNAELALKVIEAENELESMRSKFSTMNQPAPSDTPITDGLSNVACDRPEGEGWYHSFAIMLEGCRQLERELTRLSAEREKDVQALQDLVRLNHETYKATLAERDRQLAEAKQQIDIMKDMIYERGGQIDALRAELAMATDAANKGDDARCKAGAMHDMIDDLNRQLAEAREINGRLTKFDLHLNSKNQKLEDELADSQRQKAELEGRLRDAEDALETIYQNYADVVDSNQHWHVRVEQLNAERDRYLERAEEAEVRLTETQASYLPKVQEITSLTAKQLALESQCQRMKDALEQAKHGAEYPDELGDIMDEAIEAPLDLELLNRVLDCFNGVLNRLPKTGAWDSECPLCLMTVPSGDLKHEPDCVVNAITRLLKSLSPAP